MTINVLGETDILPTGSVTGRVFRDNDGDGQDTGDLGGEFGVGFLTVELLDQDGDPVLDANGTP